jgi:hypothetical protein
MNATDELGWVLALAAVILGACVAADGFLPPADAGVTATQGHCPGYGTANLVAVARLECVTAYRTNALAGR